LNKDKENVVPNKEVFEKDKEMIHADKDKAKKVYKAPKNIFVQRKKDLHHDAAEQKTIS